MTEKIVALMNAVAASGDPEQDEVYDAIDRQLGYLIGYVDAVYAQMTQLPVVRRQHQGHELRDRTVALDEKRTSAHNSAIRACETLNRICDIYKVKHVCIENLSDRRAVGDFIGDFVSEVFDERI